MQTEILFASMVDFHTIRYYTNRKVIEPALLFDGDVSVEIKSRQIFSDGGLICTTQRLNIAGVYHIHLEGVGTKIVMPLQIFDCDEFLAAYVYDSADLGATIGDGFTTFKLWAPTASQVILNLFECGAGVDAFAHVEMVRGERGVWSVLYPCGHGTYYTYCVTTAAGTQEATDPYARSAGVNGDRSMVIDLSVTDPENWDLPYRAGTDAYTKAVVWEVHIRDFSNRIGGSRYPGKFLAFTERGLKNTSGISVGLDYLRSLGITHVHLMPAFDYATVEESDPSGQFNWGYDPKNYNVPEGSYATDPFDGTVRVREFKQMVRALHDAGIGVVMDMVYNHTYDSNHALNRIVPYYYYRFDPQGRNSDACGCGNDTASERYMFRKFMVDSVVYWLKEYHLDGFRFDLMGLHDLQTMACIEKEVHSILPNALLYGEGWNMGATMDGSAQANQANIHKILPSQGAAGAIAVFNDTIRDGLKGAYDDGKNRGYINGDYQNMADRVKFGIAGGKGEESYWQVPNLGVVNYMSAHDNHTLWDKLAISNPDATVAERIAMNRLGAAIVMISRGTPFWQAGEEMLRTKGGDDNSYCSNDAVNNLDWESLIPGSPACEMVGYYTGLIRMRKSVPVFTATCGVELIFEDLPEGGMVVDFCDQAGYKAKVLINPTWVFDTYTLCGNWKLLADREYAGDESIRVDTGKITVPPCGVMVYVQ